jgi:hypothetical protein
VAEVRHKIALETGEEQADPRSTAAILEDPGATAQTLASIGAPAFGRLPPENLGVVAAALEESGGEYYRDRALDIRDVTAACRPSGRHPLAPHRRS